MKLELGCGIRPTSGYVHHDRRRHAQHVDITHDLENLPWPWEEECFEEILALDVFEHLHLMPAQWLAECYRILKPNGVLKLRVPIFGGPWHLWDPTHVRGFHPKNFEYFIKGQDLWHAFESYYFDFHFKDGTITTEDYNITATLIK